jgi:hypothetical protein
MLTYTHPYPKADVFWERTHKHRSLLNCLTIFFFSQFSDLSLLFNNFLSSQIMSNKEEEVQRAKLAEQAERYRNENN